MTSFQNEVLNAVKRVPLGRVTTYREIAIFLGNANYCRAIGNALNKNRSLVKIPCHRVVCSSGKIGGYKKGEREKKRLLKNEGIVIFNNKLVDFKNIYFRLI